MGWIAKSLGVIGNAPSEGSTKVAIKARLPDSAWKETKTKKMQSRLHQIEAYLETQCFELDKERIHLAQTLLKEHTWDCWMSQKQETPNLF
jgi:hypothetical protein